MDIAGRPFGKVRGVQLKDPAELIELVEEVLVGVTEGT